MSSTKRMALIGALAATVLAGSGCSSPSRRKPLTLQDMVAADPLPLAKGSKWTYAVNVRRFDVDTNKVITKSMTWVTEVVDARESNGVIAYRVKGWPADLGRFVTTTEPAGSDETTILRKDNSFLFGASTEPTLDGATGWFTWPVIDGQKICPTELVYCWQVTAVESGYKLALHTFPDEQSYDLEPGTGIARFHYTHHGTTNEVDARLVSYTKSNQR